jgi:hypothetical protein
MATPLLLDLDAPGFSALLRELLPPHLVTELANQYEQIHALTGHIEAYIEREEGASFNPRPARVARIVIEDGGLSDFVTVSIALWAGSSALPVIDPLPQGGLVEALRKIQDPVLETAELTIELFTVALAVLLDDVRHLHMSKRTVDLAKDLLTRAEATAESASTVNLKSPIVKKLSHAIAMQRRRREFAPEDN